MKRALNYHCRNCRQCSRADVAGELCETGFQLYVRIVQEKPDCRPQIGNFPASGDVEFQHELESGEDYAN